MKVLKLFALGICFVLGACSNQSTGHLPWRELGQYFLDLAMTYDHQDNGRFLS